MPDKDDRQRDAYPPLAQGDRVQHLFTCRIGRVKTVNCTRALVKFAGGEEFVSLARLTYWPTKRMILVHRQEIFDRWSDSERHLRLGRINLKDDRYQIPVVSLSAWQGGLEEARSSLTPPQNSP